MTENVSQLKNPLLEEDTYNGRIFHLSLPKSNELNCSWLKEKLTDTTVTLDSANLPDQDNLHIPDVFESGIENNAQLASLTEVKEFHQQGLNGVIGYLSHNESDTVQYDDKEVLILNNQQTKFLVFEHQGTAYLLIISARDSMRLLYNILANALEDLGFIIDEITISHDEFEQIAEVLIDTHLMTAVDGYEEASIDKKHIVGRGYGDVEEYKREKRQGNVHGQRFGTSQLDANNKTIQISEDCLIRSYHKLTLSMYLSMITSYILPSLSLTIQTSLSGYSSENARLQPKEIQDD